MKKVILSLAVIASIAMVSCKKADSNVEEASCSECNSEVVSEEAPAAEEVAPEAAEEAAPEAAEEVAAPAEQA